MRPAVIAILAVGCGADELELPRPLPIPRPGRVVLAGPMANPTWSADGKFVAFLARTRDSEDSRRNPMYTVVDAASHEMFEVAHADQIRFAPGRLIVDSHGELVVYDLAKAERIGAPTSISNALTFAPDGRLSWADRAGAIHLADLGTGTETVLHDISVPGDPHDSIKLEFSGDYVLAYTSKGLRVWKGTSDPIFSIDEHIGDPILADDGVTYATHDDDPKTHRLHHVALAPVHEVELHRDPTCGEGAMDDYSHALRCDTDRYLVRGPRTFCVWDTARGVVQSHFGPLLDEYHCNAEVVWAGNTPPGGPYTFFSLRTGKPTHSRPVPFYEDADRPRPRETPPPREPIAKTLDERVQLTYADGAPAWLSPAPSQAAAVGFSPDGSRLVVAGRDARVWHVDLATREMTAGKIADCDPQQDVIAVMPDGRAVLACVRNSEHRVLREGDAAPMLGNEAWPWNGVYATATMIGWVYGGRALAWRLPDGQPRWNQAESGDILAFTPDGERFVVERTLAWPDQNKPTVTLFDAVHRQIASVKPEWQVESMALAPDGKHIALGRKRDSHVMIFDDSGRIVDEVVAVSPVVGWDPSGARFAYLRDTGLAIREGGRDTEVRVPPWPIDAKVHTIAWSGARIALLADQRVMLWEGGEASTFAFTGQGGVEVRSDGSAILLGDVMTARSMLACELGPRRVPIEQCEHKLAMPR